MSKSVKTTKKQSSMTSNAAARVQRAEASTNGGKTSSDGFAARAQRAVTKKGR